MALPYPDPGMVTITGDPNNPFGGQITSQNMNTADPNETPEQTIMRLHQGGLAVDEIAQLTGFPQDQVAMQVATMTDSNTFKAGPGHALHLPTGQFRSGDELYSDLTDQSPDQVAMQDAIRAGDYGSFMPGGQFSQASTDGGIESLLSAPTDAAAPDFVDLGTTAADIAANVRGGPADPKDYLTELQLHEVLTNSGADRTDAENQALDDDPNNLGQQVTEANLAGAIARGADDEDAIDTLRAAGEIDQEFDLDNPDDLKSRLEVYKRAAEIFYDADDLKELIPQPDKSLPFMVAGAALIQAGNEGDTWGEALSNAFLQYTMSSRKEEQDYEKAITQLGFQEKQNISNFATQLFMADYKGQKELQKALLTAKKAPYLVDGGDNPQYFADEVAAYLAGQGHSIIPWTAEHGGFTEYTIFADVNGDGQPDANAPARTQLMTEAEARNKQNEGWLLREGNLTKGAKLHMVNGVPGMYTPEALEAFMGENPNADVRVVGVSNAEGVRNRATGELTWVDGRDLLTPRGQEMYSPLGPENIIVNGPDGRPILLKGDASGLATFQNRNLLGREETRVRTTLQQNDKKRNDLLTTHYWLKKLLADQRAAGKPIVFGVGGRLTTLGKNVIDQVGQLQTIFTDPKEGYVLYTDTNGNGRRDPNESASTFSQFSDQLSSQFGNSNLGRYLQGAGLGRKRVDNAILTLALQGAANDDQTGRDISDRDIERYLIRAGANATSAEEFIAVIDDLALTAIHKHENVVDSMRRLDTRLQVDPENPDEKMTMIDFMYPDLLEEQANARPFRDAPYTIRELREQLTQQPTSVLDSTDYRPRVTPPEDFVVLPGGNVGAGVGKSSIHDLYVQFMAQDDGKRMDDTAEFSPKQYGYLAKIREQMGGKDSSQWQQFNAYLNQQRQQRLSP